jgi:hypothetical protein
LTHRTARYAALQDARTRSGLRSPDGSAQLVDADQVARGIAEGAVANPVRLLGRLLDDLGAAGLQAQLPLAINSAMVRRSSSVTPGSAAGGSRTMDVDGAQLILVDNSPPASVDDGVVIRFTRNPDVPPYGLIPEATS